MYVTIILFRIIFFPKNLEMVDLCDYHNTSNVLLRRPIRIDMKEELAHATGASISVLQSNSTLLLFKSKKKDCISMPYRGGTDRQQDPVTQKTTSVTNVQLLQAIYPSFSLAFK